MSNSALQDHIISQTLKSVNRVSKSKNSNYTPPKKKRK